MRVARISLSWACLVAALLSAAGAAAQTQTPSLTDEQLQIFQSLSPEQQQAVLERLSSGDSAGDAVTGQEAADQSGLTGMASGLGSGTAGSKAAGNSTGTGNGLHPIKLEPRIPVLGPHDTVVLEVSVHQPPAPADKGPAAQSPAQSQPELSPEQKARLQDLSELLLAHNPYTLDRQGQLALPGFAPIALEGLSEPQATQRLLLEPDLAGLTVKLTRLPLDQQTVKPFGYDFFQEPSTLLSPITNLPVPADYVVGPGDRFNVQVFGNQNHSYTLTVNRDGSVSFPELGPIKVGGLSFTAAREAIQSRVAQQMIGVHADVSLGDTRAIRVFVLGEARWPGSYTVSGLATMSTGLFASGGVSKIGTLRDIQLKRQGQVIRHLDLYELLIGGDTSGDAKLLPGDVIFIPPVGPTVSIDGEVHRPALYELRGDSTVGDLVRIAGGLTPEADAGRVSLTRIEAGRRQVLDVDLTSPAGLAQSLHNGDVLHVAVLRPQLDAGVQLEGFVYRPGLRAWHEGLHLSQVLGSVEELKPGADPHYILIRRESGPERSLSLLSADLTAALAAPGSPADPLLQSRDQISVFELAPGRERIIQPLLDELQLQADLTHPTPIVSVTGSIKVPGEYPLEPGMRVADLLRAGGNLQPQAYGGSAELARRSIDASGTRQIELVKVDLAALRAGDAAANLLLQPFDGLRIQQTPDWGEQSVVLRGEVRFPGTYPIRKGETLHQVLERAGGLSSQGFPEGSVFTRADLKVLEQQQLDRLATNMRSDLVTLSMRAAGSGQANAGEALLAGQGLLRQLQAATATGRFVIDLPGLLASPVHSEKDVLLRDGDELIIPRQRQEVTVIGEVQNANSHLYQHQLTRSDYIRLSGGTTRRADSGHTYVVRADGSVATDRAIKPGDTIVVPVDTQGMPPLPFWQAVTQILYNVAISVAAINSF